MSLEFKNMDSKEKLELIFKGLEEGLEREKLAVSIGYKNYKSMDIFVRRQGYTWDRSLSKYVLPEERNNGRYSNGQTKTKGKAEEAVELFGKGELDAKEIARKLGFENHRELALYMKSKGYSWDDKKSNYSLSDRETEFEDDLPEEQASQEDTDSNHLQATTANLSDRHNTLMEYLVQKEAILRSLIAKAEIKGGEGVIPRYSVPGVFMTKSVHMTNQLDQMTRDFSKDKNVSQRELFEVALIEFFQKYGYREEVEVLLNSK